METLSFARRFLALRRNSFRTRAQIAKMQQEKLTDMLRFAFLHSPHYHRAFEQAGIRYEQIGTLPLTAYPTIDKRELIAAYDELVTVNDLNQAELAAFDRAEGGKKLFLDKYHVVHSSGSTGLPRYFVYDDAAWTDMLSGIVRGALWGMSLLRIAALLIQRPRVLYIAATDGRYGGAMAVGDGIDGVGAKQAFLDVNTPLREWVQCIANFRPNIVIGYPSAIKIMADLAQKGWIEPKVQRVISCGEPLSHGMRTHLEQALSTEMVNFYGASESLALGVEAAYEKDMVLFDDLNVVEVVDGKMYITCLYNFVQPLIRYHITDRLVLKEQAESSFSRAEIVLSRSEDVLWFEDNTHPRDFLHPLAVEGFCLDGLTDYQFVQRGGDRFTMVAVVAGDKQETVRAEMQRRMGEILRAKRLEWVHFDVRFAREIMPDAVTGKKHLIVQAG